VSEGTPAQPFRMPTPGELMGQRPGPGSPVPGPPRPSPPVPADDAEHEPADLTSGADDAGYEPADAETADVVEGAGEADSVPSPATVPARSGGTGDDRVDAALRRLDTIGDLPVSEHVTQYDAVHRTLQDALAAIDEG